ncbi:hypothetical protein D3C80_2123730 [compost metagenome]
MPRTAHRYLDHIAAAGDRLSCVVLDMAQLGPKLGRSAQFSHIRGVLCLFLISELQPIRELV